MQAETSSEDEGESEENSDDDDDLASLSRKIKRMLQNKEKFRRIQPSSSSSKPSKYGKEFNSDKLICYECKQPGHVKAECPKLKKDNFKKKKFFKKKGKAYIGEWMTDEDTSSAPSDSSDDEDEAVAGLAIATTSTPTPATSTSTSNSHLCLMAKGDKVKTFDDSSDDDDDLPSYDELAKCLVLLLY